jgi:carboxymethylenebutenolidase
MIATMLAATGATAQTAACCSAPAQFASFAAGESFRMAHELPLNYTYSGAGETVEFSTPDGGTSTAFVVRGKTSETGGKVIVMIHEWWGLNDLYDGKVAATREDAAKFMQGVRPGRAQAILRGAFGYAGKNARIGTIGWCFGGGWSLQAAMLAGNRATACVMYYGMPESDTAKLKAVSAPVLGIFAGRDQWITPVVVEQFQSNAKAAGIALTVQSYDADHAFANPSSPKFNADAKTDARRITLEFFRKNL